MMHLHVINCRWEAKLSIIGLTLGIVGNICLTFLFFPVTRTSSVLPLLGLTSEASIKYHIWLGHITMFLFTAHGLCYIVYWAVTNRLSSKVNIQSAKIKCLVPYHFVKLKSKNGIRSYRKTLDYSSTMR